MPRSKADLALAGDFHNNLPDDERRDSFIAAATPASGALLDVGQAPTSAPTPPATPLLVRRPRGERRLKEYAALLTEVDLAAEDGADHVAADADAPRLAALAVRMARMLDARRISTPWVTSMVVVPTKNDRIDFR